MLLNDRLSILKAEYNGSECPLTSHSIPDSSLNTIGLSGLMVFSFNNSIKLTVKNMYILIILVGLFTVIKFGHPTEFLYYGGSTSFFVIRCGLMRQQSLLKTFDVSSMFVFLPAIIVNGQVTAVSPFAVGTVSIVAGQASGVSTALNDGGFATQATLNYPSGVAVDSGGNVYFSDTNNQRVRMVNISTGIIYTVAGNGFAGYSGDGGLSTEASVNYPRGLAIDLNDNVYFVDESNARIRLVIAMTGIISTIAGGGSSESSGIPAVDFRFNDAKCITIASNGTVLFIGEYLSSRVTSVDLSTGIISIRVSLGFDTYGVAVDTNGGIYTASFWSNTIRYTNSTTGTASIFAGNGGLSFHGDGGLATQTTLFSPNDIALDSTGSYLYIADSYNNRVRRVNIITGIISTIAGNGIGGYNGDGVSATSASLNYPTGVKIDSKDNIYISDSNNNRIRFVNGSNGIISTIAGNPSNLWSGDGFLGPSASLNEPTGMTACFNMVYFADTGNHRVRQLNLTDGIISTVAGNGFALYSGDGGPGTSASLNTPVRLACDGSGNIIISDRLNHRIRRVNSTTGIISTISGNGIANYTGDGGPATSASIWYPTGVAVDTNDNLFFINPGKTFTCIRRVDSATGIISSPPMPGALSVSGNVDIVVWDLAIDPKGNLYIADTYAWVVRLWNVTSNTFTVLAGNFYSCCGVQDGVLGTSSIMSNAYGVALDTVGNIYIADRGSGRIRMVNSTTGIISTAALNLNSPQGVAVDFSTGNIYFSDTGNNCIRRLLITTVLPVCPLGTVRSLFSLNCSYCSAGTYWSDNACLKCPSGSSSVDNSRTCYCLAGYYSIDGFYPSGCKVCPSGTFNTVIQASSCQICSTLKSGYFPVASCSLIGDMVQEPCPSGSFSGAPPTGVCIQCPKGTFASGIGSSSCKPCDTLGIGNYTLTPCIAGSNLVQLPCPIGKYSDGSNPNIFCSVCPDSRPTLHEGSTTIADCICSDYYTSTIHGTCIPCREGMICPPGTRFNPVNVSVYDGYLVLGNSNLTILPPVLRCINPLACIKASCAYPFTGFLCASCIFSDGYFQSNTIGDPTQCESCNAVLFSVFPISISMLMGGLFIGFVTICIQIYGFHRKTVSTSRSPTTNARDKNRVGGKGGQSSDNKGVKLSLLVKLVTNQLQVISIVGQINFKLPLFTNHVLHAANAVSSGQGSSFSLFASGVRCLLYIPNVPVPVNALLVILYIVVFNASGLTLLCLIMKLTRRRFNFTKAIRLSFAGLCFSSYTNIFKAFFQLFSCQSFNEGSNGAVGPLRLVGSYDTLCFDSDHLYWIIFLGIPVGVIIVVGLPVFAIILIYQHQRHDLASSEQKDDDTLKSSVLSFLYVGHKEGLMYWELVPLGRKISLSIIAVFNASFLDTFTVALIAIAIFVISMLLQLTYRPYINEDINRAEFIAQGVSFITVYMGLWTYQNGSDGISGIMVDIFITGINIIWFLSLLKRGFTTMSDKLIRKMTETSRPPSLELGSKSKNNKEEESISYTSDKAHTTTSKTSKSPSLHLSPLNSKTNNKERSFSYSTPTIMLSPTSKSFLNPLAMNNENV